MKLIERSSSPAPIALIVIQTCPSQQKQPKDTPLTSWPSSTLPDRIALAPQDPPTRHLHRKSRNDGSVVFVCGTISSQTEKEEDLWTITY